MEVKITVSVFADALQGETRAEGVTIIPLG